MKNIEQKRKELMILIASANDEKIEKIYNLLSNRDKNFNEIRPQ